MASKAVNGIRLYSKVTNQFLTNLVVPRGNRYIRSYLANSGDIRVVGTGEIKLTKPNWNQDYHSLVLKLNPVLGIVARSKFP